MKLNGRVCWMLMLHFSILWSIGQPVERSSVQGRFGTDNLKFVLNRMADLETTQLINMTEWGEDEIVQRRYMGITHVPSSDFNIYLTFNNAVTPRILTSLEVSLNYAGVMNLKSQILLRKRSNKNRN